MLLCRFANALAIFYELLLISNSEAFLYANDDSRYESLLKTTVGLVFLGTPFQGSKWQPLADALTQLMGLASSHYGITRELGLDEPALRDRVYQFCKLRNKLSTPVACFSELHETDYRRRLGIAGVAKGIEGKSLLTIMLKHVFLFVTDPLEDKKTLKRKKGDRAAGTCEWILGTDDLTAWLGPSHNQNSEIHTTQVLWLHGNPGTGKSTLAMYLTDVLSTGFSATDGNTMAYFFCDSAFDTRRTATSVVRGLLLQLIQQHPSLLSYVLPKYNERKAKLFESFDALWTIFISAAADRNTGRKYCIIDALDECDDESQRTLLRQLQETFHSSDAPPNVRILVTSRPYPEIRKHLEIFTHKDLASFPDVKQDIDQCIKERVAQLKYTEKIKRRVTEILRDKAGGTFLWVGIACNELEYTPSKDAILCLEAMPSGLHSLYEKLFSAGLEKEREKGTIRLVLGFVAVSQRPLSLLELSEACRLRQDEDDTETRTQFMREYIESCRLMVVIQDETVLLLHQSVKDYLIKAGEKAHFSEFQAHADLAYRCIDHLIEQFQGTKQTHGHFSDYANQLGAVITRKMTLAAAGIRNGKDVMALLLEQRGDEITITEEVVIAAMGNVWNGKEVMALLLEQRGDEITITEEVVIAAAENWGNGKEVMALLLE
ncbi:hypothetical protein ARSEF4850_003621 [Beauveria asiatica]